MNGFKYKHKWLQDTKNSNIKLIGLFCVFFSLTTCNSGNTTATTTPKESPSITSFSLRDPNSSFANKGLIKNESIVVAMPFRTNVKSLVATFKTRGESVSVYVEGKLQKSEETFDDFTNTLKYEVKSANGQVATYVVTVTKAAFSAYYPDGCKLNNESANESGTCECIQDTTTGSVWILAKINTKFEETYPNCPQLTGFDEWNAKPHCGLTGGWHLPKAVNGFEGLLSESNPRGDWSHLYDIATSGSVPPGREYRPREDLSVWMNNNGFQYIASHAFYLTEQYLYNRYEAWVLNIGSGTPALSNIKLPGDTSRYFDILLLRAEELNPPAIISFSLRDPNGGFVNKGVIVGESIVVTMPFRTNLESLLVAEFKTTGESVIVYVRNDSQISEQTLNLFKDTVKYEVKSHGRVATYVVTVTKAAFSAYYPDGCKLNNESANESGTCECIQDTTTGSVWILAKINTKFEETYPNCPQLTGFDEWNAKPHCGLTGGWHLPKAVNGFEGLLSEINPGGDWSHLYDIATSGSAPPGREYSPKEDLSVWMNNNGFQNIAGQLWYLGSIENQKCLAVINPVTATSIPMETPILFSGEARDYYQSILINDIMRIQDLKPKE